MTNRRDFIKQIGAVCVTAPLHNLAFPQSKEKYPLKNNDLVWASLIHLSYNMWQDYTAEKYKTKTYRKDYSAEQVAEWAHYYQPELTCESEAWDAVIKKMSQSGLNMVVIDLGDGVLYDSHPEISVKNAWTVEHLKKKLSQIRNMGMEPIPKLNFSAGHKAWLGKYQYMLSSDIYYAVCRDLITEVIDIFGKPRFFHIGMDEETCDHQSDHRYTVVRRGDIWWKDFYYLVEQVERNNVRSWIWSDNAWRNKEEFFRKMPKTVLQSNWDYEEQTLAFNENGEPNDAIAQAYIDLEKHGYDQVPTGSLWLNGHWNNYGNLERLVYHTKRIINPERLKGFMQTVWMPTLQPCLDTHYKAVDVAKRAKEKY
ncbi:MAG: Tat pathway signal protein [Fermentimonas sp.]|jgi:hypothetical protein